MVFEAVVVDLLNKFLKQYIENLDTSQLKIGIWGGDVVLKDLFIKCTLFEDLNLPVKVKWGKLGKLAIKIPWKNLYSSQAIVEFEELLVIIVPNSELKYDAYKEEKWAQEKKQTKLKAIEEARRREEEQEPMKQDGFIEKLITQITKNLQIVIKNIHIRYEDKTTIPGSPFSVGVTLCNLSALTTVSDPTMNFSQLMQENENFICKVLNLEGLAVYWNSSSPLFSDLSQSDMSRVLLESIPRFDYKPNDFKYMFGPLSSSAFLRINPKPECDGSNFKIPKIFVNIHLKEIELAVTHNQFNDLMSYLQDFNRFVAASKYRKYRPVGIPVIGHAKEWWNFAYVCVLEDITRRKRECSWENIKDHRHCCRKYAELFKLKLKQKKMPFEDLNELNKLEKKLNLFNLVLIREQVYMAAERNVKETKSGGWFSGWFGYGSEVKSDASDGEIVKKIQSVMTTNEKQKLYKAIGYEESAPLTIYPATFVQLQFWFHLDEIKTTVYDDREKQPMKVLMLSVRSVKMEFEQRPSNFGMKCVVIIGNFHVKGKRKENESYPELVTSNCTESESLVELLYEKKPLNATCDQRIIISARPLRIIYDAATIRVVRDVFSTGTHQEMEKIVSATAASLPTFRRITSLGLQYAIEKRTELEVKVNIMSSYLIIPYGGAYHPGKDMLVLLLGKLSVVTEENTNKNISVKKLFLEGTTNEEIFSTVLSASYTNFKCHLTGLQVIFQLSGEDWVAASKKQRSTLQFLEPTNVEVTIKKSLVLDDARIPKMIIEGKMPSVTVNFHEERFIRFVELASSVSSATAKPAPLSRKGASSSVWSLQSLSTHMENKFINIQKEYHPDITTEYTQGIDLVVHFEMNEFAVIILKSEMSRDANESRKVTATETKFLSLRIVKLEMDFTSKTFEVINLFKLGGIHFKQFHGKEWLPVVSTKLNQDYLFVVEYISLDTKIPDLFTAKGGIVNRLTLNITPLKVLLEKEALLAQIEFLTHVQRRVESVQNNVDHVADAGLEKGVFIEDSLETTQIDKKVIARGKRFRKKTFQKEVIDFFLQASLDEIVILVQFENQGLAEFDLKGCSVNISTQKSYATVDVNLREILLLDLNYVTKHPKIVSSLEKQTLSSRVTLYNKEYFGSDNSLDMSVEAEVGGIQCTFVALFFYRAFEYLAAFQSQIETLKEGVTMAAEKAKENVVKAFHNAAQICLKIKIAAPILLIPTSSVSVDMLAIDLGVLTIKNSITELEYTPEGGPTKRPLMDSLKVHLQNLKMSRWTLRENSLENEKLFLVPVTFDLNVKRNLSMGWFRVIPELEIVARLATVRVMLTHEDLCSILQIIRENLSEGEQNIGTELHPGHRRAEKKVTEVKTKEQKLFAHHESLTEVSTNSSNFYTIVKFMFFMDSFVFDALCERSKTNEKEVGLGRFVLENMSLKGRMFSNNSIHTSMMLVSCVLDDTRPGTKRRITRFMQRTVDSNLEDSREDESSTDSMIELIFNKKQEDSFLDLRVCKFTLILSMDYLQKLGEFFTIGDAMGPATVKEPVRTIDKQMLNVPDRDVVEQTFTVNVRLEKPDIIIVENMDSTTADALVFHTEIVMKYRLAGSKKVISGTLRNAELYSCCVDPTKRPFSLNQIVKPFTISIAGSTPEDSGLHVDICLTEISVSISPATADLISKCYEALLKDSSIGKEDGAEKTYSDLWDVKPFYPNDCWYLRPEIGQDVLSLYKSHSSLSEWESDYCDEICLLAIPSITILIEGVSSSKAEPLILLEMGFQMRCCNWSSRMTLMNSLTLQMHYYNGLISTWEPLIEPIERVTKGSQKRLYTPWELNCSVVHCGEAELEELRPPKVQITLSCTDVLQVTLTKTGIDVLKTVAGKYTNAVTQHLVKKSPDLPPYVVKNETGIPVELLLEESKLQVCKGLSEKYNIVRLDSNSEVELLHAYSVSSELNRNLSLSALKKETTLHVRFPAAENHVFELPLGKKSKLFYSFPTEEAGNVNAWDFVCDVSILHQSTIVVLRSTFTIINYFYEPINVHRLSEDATVGMYVGVVEGKSSYNLPFHAVYNEYNKLFFSVNGYSLSCDPFDLKALKEESNTSCLLQCSSKAPEIQDPFFIQAVGETEQIYNAKRRRKTAESRIFKIHLQPTVKIFNSLPCSLVICFQGNAAENLLHPGNYLEITNGEPGTSTVTIRIADYLEKEWSCKETILENPSEFLVWKFVSYNGLAPETLNLGVHVTYKRKTAVYSIYSPYLMINKTGYLLSYKFEHNSSVFFHPGNLTLPVMFSPNSKKFFSKKCASLQVNQSHWSEVFPIDVAGSGGTVECRMGKSDAVYKVSVSISLTYNSLTKVVVFTPYYVLINSTDFTIECQESNFHSESWLELPSNSYIPFWPHSRAKGGMLQVRPKNSDAVSPAFLYNSTDVCLLRLSDKHGGIHVNIKATQSGSYITFSSYEVGQAPALIINYSKKVITVGELNTSFTVTLNAFEQIMHAWVLPSGERKFCVKGPDKTKTVIAVNEDDNGLLITETNDRLCYISFLDGTQRVLMFTDDQRLSGSISSGRSTCSGVELISRIQGIGFSLVNDLTQVEVLYLSFISSGITWQTKKSGKKFFRQAKNDVALRLENEYQKYKENKEAKEADAVVVVGDKKMTVGCCACQAIFGAQVNFETMEMLEPTPGQLRRTFEPGLWLAYRQIEDKIMLHVKVNRIQIDSQYLDSLFPVILAPIPPPKSIACREPKPFFELSVVKITTDRSGVDQYKYFKTLVQEIDVKMDVAFIQQLYMFWTAEEMSDEQEKLNLKKDLEFMQQPLKSHVEVVSSHEQKNFYDLLHFSPLKIHFSFSLAGKLETDSNFPPALSVLLQSLGVTLTDVTDVIFRLSFFERKNVFFTNKELLNEIYSHYYGQIVRQAYVLLLGLDVIGNPYGLIVGIGEGVEALFYEPMQGIIQGPSEFGKGMAIGWKRMFDHTVGSAASTLGKLTGTLGKGLAVLSLDKEYQIQRMVDHNQYGNIQSSMARGGRGMVMGVLEGVSGIVKKPIKGAQEEGVGGFFKGMGKGMIGLVTRPVTGIVDFASTSLNAVKRATVLTADCKRVRPPRYFRSDSAIEPYNLKAAQGHLIFHLICKRKYCGTDTYEYHTYLKEKEVVVLTNKRIILADYSDTFGTWQEHMAILWKSMPEKPRLHTKGVALTMPVKSGPEKKDVKVLLIDEESEKTEIYTKMLELYRLEKEENVDKS